MDILGLPGINDHTGPWMDRILRGISSGSDRAETQYYTFWTSAEKKIDAPAEIARAARFAPELIVAKSMGTLLTIRGVFDGVLRPARCVLIGIPVGNASNEIELLKRWENKSIPTLFIQQEQDVTGSFRQLSNLVTASDNCALVQVPGSDHVYSDTDALTSTIRGWLARQ